MYLLVVMPRHLFTANSVGEVEKVTPRQQLKGKKVWEIVKNFMKYDWNSSIKKVIAENNEVGAERKLEFDGGKFIKQKLEKLDETNRISKEIKKKLKK